MNTTNLQSKIEKQENPSIKKHPIVKKNTFNTNLLLRNPRNLLSSKKEENNSNLATETIENEEHKATTKRNDFDEEFGLQESKRRRSISYNEFSNLIKIFENNEGEKFSKEVIETLGLKKDENIKIENLIDAIKERRTSKIYSDLYNKISDIFIPICEKVILILKDARKKFQDLNLDIYSNDMDWVINKINSQDIYNCDLNYDYSNLVKSHDLEDFENSMKLIMEYSSDQFNKNKKDDVIQVNKISNIRKKLVDQAGNIKSNKSVKNMSSSNIMEQKGIYTYDDLKKDLKIKNDRRCTIYHNYIEKSGNLVNQDHYNLNDCNNGNNNLNNKNNNIDKEDEDEAKKNVQLNTKRSKNALIYGSNQRNNFAINQGSRRESRSCSRLVAFSKNIIQQNFNIECEKDSSSNNIDNSNNENNSSNSNSIQNITFNNINGNNTKNNYNQQIIINNFNPPIGSSNTNNGNIINNNFHIIQEFNSKIANKKLSGTELGEDLLCKNYHSDDDLNIEENNNKNLNNNNININNYNCNFSDHINKNNSSHIKNTNNYLQGETSGEANCNVNLSASPVSKTKSPFYKKSNSKDNQITYFNINDKYENVNNNYNNQNNNSTISENEKSFSKTSNVSDDEQQGDASLDILNKFKYRMSGITNKSIHCQRFSISRCSIFNNLCNNSKQTNAFLSNKGSDSPSNSFMNLKLEKYFKKFEEFDFNVFEYSEICGRENVLINISDYLFEKNSLYCFIDKKCFETFIDKIRVGYDYTVPYHNDLHAVDVLQTSSILMKFLDLINSIQLTLMDVCGFLIAAIIHDYKHPGLNNSYQINKKSKIATRYNDISVLENYHVSAAFKVISKPNSNIFKDLQIEEYRFVRKRIVECVLATDMAKHTKAQTSLRIKIESLKKPGEENANMKNYLLEGLVNNLEVDNKFDRQQEILNFLIHNSDISNPAKPFNICKIWTDLVMEEFFVQGDLEKKRSLPVSFLCDRNTTNIPKSQIGFISNIVLPNFKILAMLNDNCNIFVDNLLNNIDNWKKEDEKQQRIQEKKNNILLSNSLKK